MGYLHADVLRHADYSAMTLLQQHLLHVPSAWNPAELNHNRPLRTIAGTHDTRGDHRCTVTTIEADSSRSNLLFHGRMKMTSLVPCRSLVTFQDAQVGFSTPSLFDLSISFSEHPSHHQKLSQMTDSLLADETNSKGLLIKMLWDVRLW